MAQIASTLAVVGSYFAAEVLKTRQLEARRRAARGAGASGTASTQL